MLGWWADDHQPQQPLRVSNAIMTEEKDEPCWQRTDGLNRKVVITGKYSSLGLWNSCSYCSYIPLATCNSAPCWRGRTRQAIWNKSITNVIRQQKKRWFSALFKWVQHEQTETMRIYPNVTCRCVKCSLPHSRNGLRHRDLLTSFAAMQVATSWRQTAKTELISRMKLSVQVGQTVGRDRDSSLRCVCVCVCHTDIPLL